MTSLVAWVGCDSHSLSSAYIATDSRISWLRHETWDRGRKTFASTTFPDIFGYVGDVMFPSVVLSQYVTALDLGTYGDLGPDERIFELAEMAEEQVLQMPKQHQHPFTIVHCVREGTGNATSFRLGVFSFHKDAGVRREVLVAPKASAELIVLGSGTRSVKKHLANWKESDASGTSRAVFGAFVSSVDTGADPRTAPPVQAVALRRKGNGQVLGIWHDGTRYLAGSPARKLDSGAGIEWFNSRFERCDSQTGAVIGQRQPVPSGIAGPSLS